MPDCVIPSCDRHSETLMCSVCWARLRAVLERTDELVDELELTRTRRDKIGGVPLGRPTHPSESTLPIRPHAAQVGDKMRDLLASWVRDLWETYAIRWNECQKCAARFTIPELDLHRTKGCPGKWTERTADLGDIDITAPGLARWVLRHRSWVRAHAAGDDLYTELVDAYRAVIRTIDRPEDRTYIGMCSAELDDGLCEVDLFARESQGTVRCPGCDSVWDVSQRREHLTAAVDHQYLPPGLTIAAVTRRGHRLTASMLRNWRARGRLVGYVEDPDFMGPVQHGWHVRPIRAEDDAVPLYLVSEVIDVVQARYRRAKTAEREAS